MEYIWTDLWLAKKKKKSKHKKNIYIIKKNRLKWFSHVILKDKASYVNYSHKNDLINIRLEGQPSKQWSDIIRKDTKLLLLSAMIGERQDEMEVMCGQIYDSLCWVLLL